MKCKGIQYRNFSKEQLEQTRDSVLGYNDELAYAILEGQNAGQFILGHVGVKAYNFLINTVHIEHFFIMKMVTLYWDCRI